MDGLALFGLFAVTAMLVSYALEERSPWYILAFAVACALGSIYGFLQGALAVRDCGSDLGSSRAAAVGSSSGVGGIAERSSLDRRQHRKPLARSP